MSKTKFILLLFLIAMMVLIMFNVSRILDMVHSENPSAKTNEGIVSMDNNLNDFRNEVKASETQVINRTVVIRETVAEAANAMPPDELVNGVLYELELFRRGASPDQSLYRPSGVHSSGDLVPDERRSYENRL